MALITEMSRKKQSNTVELEEGNKEGVTARTRSSQTELVSWRFVAEKKRIYEPVSRL